MELLGDCVGGVGVGSLLGLLVVAMFVGAEVGFSIGLVVGFEVGLDVGFEVGLCVGFEVGTEVAVIMVLDVVPFVVGCRVIGISVVGSRDEDGFILEYTVGRSAVVLVVGRGVESTASVGAVVVVGLEGEEGISGLLAVVVGAGELGLLPPD